MPPIAIVITKCDKFREAKIDDIEEAIKESFSALFIKNRDKKKIVTIIPVSIGKNISDNDYSGRLEPVNIHIPIFWGIWFTLKKICS